MVWLGTVALLAACGSAPAGNDAATSPTHLPTSANLPIAPRDPAVTDLSNLPACIDPSPPTTAPVEAVTATGQTFTRQVSIDDGSLVLDPVADPAPADVAARARCTLLATSSYDGTPVVFDASQVGSTFGLARVTISLPPAGQSRSALGTASRPRLTSWHDRLAWVLLVTPQVGSSCPTDSPTAPATPHLPGYQALMLDARTGSDAIDYVARSNAPCNFSYIRGADVTDVVEAVSVPFTTSDRSPDGLTVRFRVQARTCDRIPPGTFVNSDTHSAAVTIERPLTGCSGTPRDVTGTLSGARAGRRLPPVIAHGPVGAVDTLTG